jgi:HSP20 family protein
MKSRREIMADVKVQNQSKEQQQPREQQQREQQQRGLSRRQEYYPSRELFGFSPFSMMRRLTEEMDRAFGSTFGLGRGFGSEQGAWSPAVEVRERDNNLEITAELPGLTKDDVKVECTDEGIVLEGEKRRESESEEGGIHRSERTYGRFYRMIPLPEGTDVSKVKAEFKNGVLQIQAPLSEQHRKSRQVPIT